jgi:catechol 2,3-dioxygenase-like lactoylglutathione lyase family enzyme
MSTIDFDHTIIPSHNKERSAKFYEDIFGFEDIGEMEGMHAVRINSTSILFILDHDNSPWSQGVRHYAFTTDKKKFDQIIAKIKASGIPYGDEWDTPENMKGPTRKSWVIGAKGKGETLYFKDPYDNLLQLITY